MSQNTVQNPRAAAALNHLTHGATSQSLFLPGESSDEFFALLEGSFEHHQPTNPQDSGLVADTVLARWFLLRRQRIYVEKEAAFHHQKPSPDDWLPADLDHLNRFDRYKTQAERALNRALNNVRHIRKEAQSHHRWQAMFKLQKQRFKAAKPKAAPPPPPPPPQPDPDPIPGNASTIPQHHQTLFIGLEDEKTVIYNVSPTNSQIRKVLTASDSITRTYNFVGGVPEAYQHLVTPDSVTWGMSTSVIHTHTYSEWRSLSNRE